MDNTQPLVSIIVPNYNYAHYLDARLESILNQTFQDYELIILDDASTDNSIDVINKYRDNPHVTHIEINEENTGSPFMQWMKGIKMSRGKYIWIAEADDYADYIFLETCVKWIKAFDNVSVCYVGSKLLDAQGRTHNKDINHWKHRAKKSAVCFDGMEYATRNLYWKNYIINASAVLFNREYALSLVQSAFVNMHYCGDWLFWFEMALQGQVVEIYTCLNYFRQHADKVTVKSRSLGDGVLEDISVVRHMEEKLGHLLTYKKRLRRGLLYRKIKRLPLDDETQRNCLYQHLFDILESNKSDYYLERRNQLLRLVMPRLMTVRRERL